VGKGDLSFASSVVAEHAKLQSEIHFGSFPGPPLVSVFFYDATVFDPLEEFTSASSLPESFKGSLGEHVASQACVMVSWTSRETWAAGGVVFLDQSRLPEKADRRRCLETGLDYINGFPTTAEGFDYTQLPSTEVRRLILGAVLECSLNGPYFSEPEERTRDGFTPLPTLGCVEQNLGD
jgi:hypothetical protein